MSLEHGIAGLVGLGLLVYLTLCLLRPEWFD